MILLLVLLGPQYCLAISSTAFLQPTEDLPPLCNDDFFSFSFFKKYFSEGIGGGEIEGEGERES